MFELFDQSWHIEWLGSRTGTFNSADEVAIGNVNGHKVEVIFRENQNDFGLESEIHFTINESFEKTVDAQLQWKVFSFVANAAKIYIGNKNPVTFCTIVNFGDTSRFKLYQTMFKRMASAYHYPNSFKIILIGQIKFGVTKREVPEHIDQLF